MTVAEQPIALPDVEQGRTAFVADLLVGADAVPAVDAERIVELVRARAFSTGCPIPVAVAWNTVHFGWSPTRGGYEDAVIYGEELPTVNTADNDADALPVGAVVWVVLGGDNYWAELVGKIGRPEGLEDGIAPASMVGAAATVAVDGRAVVREAWGFDFGIFGPADPAVDTKLRRLARRGKLDQHCLYDVNARYESAESANDTDAEFFTRWMVENQAVLLMSGPLYEFLTEHDDATLAAGVATSMASIADICDTSERLVRWNDAWMPIEWVYEVEDLPNLVLHAHDLEHIATELASPGRTVDVGWVSLAQRIDDLLERRQQADPHARGRNREDRTIFDDHAGVAWLRALATSGRWIADIAIAHQGVIRARNGNRKLRVDDGWAHGGLWRSAPEGFDHPLLEEIPEDIPLLLGAEPDAALREYFGFDPDQPLPTSAEPAAEPHDDTHTVSDTSPAQDDTPDADASNSGQAEPEDNEPGNDEELPVEQGTPESAPARDEPADLEDSVVSVTVTLRAADIVHQTLPLPSAITWLRPAANVTVRIIHEGTDPTLAVQTGTLSDDGFFVTGIEWPESCFEGIRVGVSALVGATVLSVLTTPLDEPVEIAGIEYRHQFDRTVVDTQRPERPLSMASLLISAISRCGRVTYGTRRASARTLVSVLFGEHAPPLLATIVEMALADLHERGRLKLYGTEYVWYQDLRARRPRRFVADDFDTRQDLVLVVRRHIVLGHLRRLSYWQSASGEAHDEYRLAHRSGNRRARAPELPTGYTWVRDHPRGTEITTTVNALAVADGGLHSRADIEHDVRRSFNIEETA